ncbi:16S rRNA (adenine(1518)-N(6)/adenine(1519)-N(6))-dimethyltransferase RsmA [Rhodohalobacter sp.]|uniref:16S rRNA (adenine(1518)-N(6)/adenine(1519)-N(6))- dimethyltransferase RsmA n=1 Tax=Rhodohalobacter sp. TaxID=1974210 RepID=UPI002ACD67F3|nr:16S rRNA (adenine(1518)-N(6)/adenine(1519)-N(6))-dimethyltransferase RsmA [Rhodohalobacter sp.]MDZ7755609.1 16S rRNA (adenine(1518)-N(6)/adenine(1519)-N(6))-dimethyltransferase RsmA [Rhodohalobacter sp.]
MANHPRTKKSLGQHFLKDPNMIQKIVDSIPAQKEDRIVEIGPGAGAITGLILQAYDDVVAVEIDQRMVEHLTEEYPDLKIVNEDILKSDWSEFVIADKPVHVVGNLPYYITSQILFKVLEYRKHITSALLMMQKEVAERIVAEPRNKEYGILSVQTQLMSSPEILFDVPPGVFSPPPNVNSAVLKLTFDQPDLTCSDKNLKTVVRMAFNQRRKKLSNALKRLDTELPEDEFDFNLRAEALTPEMYEKLTARLEQLGTFS